MNTCPQCGTASSPHDRFCSHCGFSFEDATGVLSVVDDTGEISGVAEDPTAGLAAGDAVLVVRRGPDAGSRFVLSGGVGAIITAGRAEDSSIFLDDVTVSRKHVEFRRIDSGWSVTDVGSLNGTYVNKDRIDSKELGDGDEVQVGKYRFVFHKAHAADGGVA